MKKWKDSVLLLFCLTFSSDRKSFVAVSVFSWLNRDTRYYDLFSDFKINLPTLIPTMLRSSLSLIECLSVFYMKQSSS